MERVMEVLKSMDINYIYVIVGIVVVLVILNLIWVIFIRKRGPSAEEIKNAEMALSEAKQKEADLYAQDEYQRAKDSLAEATHLLAAKEYRKAKKAVEEATGQARQASKAVEENKAKMKAEDERMLSDFNRQVDELKIRAAKPGTDSPTEVPREVQELVGKWEIMKMRIPDLIQRGRIREAHDELKTIEGVLNNAQRQDVIAQPRAENLGRKAMPVAAAPVKKTWPWIILIIALAAILLLWLSYGKETSVQNTSVQDTVKQGGEQVSDTSAALGQFVIKKLPNGIELNIPELGVENKLIAFIEDTQRAVDDKTWFTFDRLTFETGKATLKPESQEQLKNIAEILKAYPKVTLKLGGYTDNTGDPQANRKLSQLRAETVMGELVEMGVDAGRLKAKGYGQEHPVADNSTEDGRAKNRRIALLVTSK